MGVVEFEKWHGAGNDFIIIDLSRFTVSDRSAFAIRECDRESGIGADGVLFVRLHPDTDPVRVKMTLVQPDGSTAAMCGNGARCVAKWAAVRTGADSVIVETPAGDRAATIHPESDDVTVEMGTPTFEPESVPVSSDGVVENVPVGGLRVTAVNTGVPHAVAFVEDVDLVELDEEGPLIRHAAIFPDGANVTLADRRNGRFRQRTFERGVEGETVACGTGAVAIAAVAYRTGLIEAGDSVVVSPPGGSLIVTIRADGSAALRGPVVNEGGGEFRVPQA